MANTADLFILLMLLCCCSSSVAATVGLYYNCNQRTWDVNNFDFDSCTNFDFSPSQSPSPSSS